MAEYILPFTAKEIEEKLGKVGEPTGGNGGINISAARVGQTIVVKAVDENGVPTEWEAVDLPKSTNVIAVDSYEDLPDAGSVSKGTIALVTSEG